MGMEHFSDHFIHREWATMHVKSLRIIQRTYLFEKIMVYVPLEVRPVVWRAVKDVMKLYSVAFRLEFFSEDNVFFSFICVEQNQFSVIVFHAGNFHYGLKNGSNSTSSSNKEDAFYLCLESV